MAFSTRNAGVVSHSIRGNHAACSIYVGKSRRRTVPNWLFTRNEYTVGIIAAGKDDETGMNSNPSAGSILAVPTMSPTASRMLSNSGIGKRLLTVAEAAGYLGLQVDTVYKKARLRELPSVKVGRALRFDVKALERFVEQHTIETID